MTSNSHSDSTCRLREKIRAYQSIERCVKRENETDSLRPGLGEILQIIHELENLTENDVSGLASRIKRRKHASSEDMLRLSHAFLQSEENIVTFMKIPGGLNVIIKELTGTDAKSQIMACEVLCNLSLGDLIPCEKIASAAGSYLITNLDNSDSRLQTTSLWVVTNILNTNGKGCSTLLSQEVAPKLLHLLIENKEVHLSKDILIAINILLDNNMNIFSPDQIQLLRHQLQLPKTLDGLQTKMLFEILFSADDVPQEENVLPLAKIAISTLNEVQDLTLKDNIQRVLYSIRIVSNLSVKFPQCYNLVENECNINLQMEFPNIINKIFSWNDKFINLELLWLLNNLVKCEEILNKPKSILQSIKLTKLTIL